MNTNRNFMQTKQLFYEVKKNLAQEHLYTGQ